MLDETQAQVLNFEIAKALRDANGNLLEINRLARLAVDKLADIPIGGLEPKELFEFVRNFSELKYLITLTSPEVISATREEVQRLGRQLTPAETKRLAQSIDPSGCITKLR